MSNINNAASKLGRIRIFGHRHPDPAHPMETLWRIDAYTPRVPATGNLPQDDTPGAHGLRTLILRTEARPMEFSYPNGRETKERFTDPLLLDVFLKSADQYDKEFDIEIFGVKTKVRLMQDARVQATPLWEHPDIRNLNPSLDAYYHNMVPGYLLQTGSLQIDASTLGNGIPPELDKSQPIELMPDGIVFSANVPPPDGNTPISTRLRMHYIDRNLRVELVNPQPPTARAAWLAVWSGLNDVAAATRSTAWLRLHFAIDTNLPTLSWQVTRQGQNIKIDWSNVELPEGVAQITLADQPLESQLLAPLQVLQLMRRVTLSHTPGSQVLEVSTASTAAIPAPQAHYTWNGKHEQIIFKKLPMVHDAGAVRQRLFNAYCREAAVQELAVGFMRLKDGWAEIPFDAGVDPVTQKPTLPPVIVPNNAPKAKGSLWLGTRRPEFYDTGKPLGRAPWSLQLDEPSDFSLQFTFNLPSVAPNGSKIAATMPRADVKLDNFALTARGVAWLAATSPDGNDALPIFTDNPDDYIDLLLRYCDEKKAPAPFILDSLRITAPTQPKLGWDQGGNRADRLPTAVLNLSINLHATAPARKTQRVWLRHVRLPSMQILAATRSDPLSHRPHASRALTPFDAPAGLLKLDEPLTMTPQLSASTRTQFLATQQQNNKAPLVTLVALTLPGVELEATSPDNYSAKGAYTLPIWEELHARATLPPPEDATEPVPAPIVTALDPIKHARLMHDNLTLRANAATQHSQMFPVTTIGTAATADAQNLYPPFVWKAEVNIDEKVLFGKASFTDGEWIWDASGDDLLQGPAGVLKLNNQQCSVAKQGGPNDPTLVGWSVAEHNTTQAGVSFIRDGRGLLWVDELTVSAGLIRRHLEVKGAANPAFWLLSTDQPVAVGGLAGVAWELSFTDIPIAQHTLKMAMPANQTTKATQAWTWSLSQPSQSRQDLALVPLSLGPCLRFVPTALKSLTLASNKTAISEVSIEGTLVLGVDNRAVASDTLRHVKITMKSTGAGALVISQIQTVDNIPESPKPILWDLDLESSNGIVSGAPQLRGELAVVTGTGGKNELEIKDMWLTLRLFNLEVDIGFGTVSASATEATNTTTTAGSPSFPNVKVTKATVNLEKASLTKVEIEVVVREGVSCVITHDKGSTSASLTWFGNSITCTTDIDALRSTCVLSRMRVDASGIQVFPGQPEAKFKDGILCLGFGPKDAGLELNSYFLELAFDQDGLQLTNMLHSRAGQPGRDRLRFDGIWAHRSLVRWPRLQVAPLGPRVDTQEIDFATALEVEHEVSFMLSDHCLEGARFEPVSQGKGIRISAKSTSQASTWLVETVHRFKVSGHDTCEIRCLDTLQFWRPSTLAADITATWEKQERLEGFVFVPGYIGLGANKSTKEFVRPGVRRADHSFAGLFDERIVSALSGGASGDDAWLLLGSTTALCRNGTNVSSQDATAPYALLHLPFVGVLGEIAGLPPLLKVATTGTKLRMSRHDIDQQQVRVDGAVAQSPGELITQPLRGDLPFIGDLRPLSLLSGTLLARNWFTDRPVPLLPGWHIEQLQRPGATPKSESKLPVLPFPYPRAALMLARLLDVLEGEKDRTHETLSILTGINKRSGNENAQTMDVELRVIRLQPGTAANYSLSQDSSNAIRKDLIIGGPQGVVAIALAESDTSAEDDRHLITLAIANMAQLTFIILRCLADTGGSYRYCALPSLDPDPLTFSVRALRGSGNYAVDGRLTWPAPEGVQKSTSEVRAPLRSPKQYAAPLAMAGVTTGVSSALLMGEPFLLDAESSAGKRTETIWVQEWEHVSFADTPAQSDDAAPWMRDAATTSCPLVPSTRELSNALIRLDPALAPTKDSKSPRPRSIQTWLPAATIGIDFASRAGAFVTMGLRGLRSVNVTHRQFEPADAGPADLRSLRRPRPVSLPANGNDEQAWRRTVGCYAKKDQTCLPMVGAWDLITAPLIDTDGKLSSEVPSWSLFVGQPQPFGLVTEASGSLPAWRGAVVVQCLMFDAKGEPLPKPAQLALSIFNSAQQETDSLRCGLRVGARVIAVTQIALITNKDREVSKDQLVFSLGGGEQITSGDCTLECRFIPPQRKPDQQMAPLTIAPPKKRETLESASLRTLVLPVRGPMQDRYPLPILRRTLFFADPAFDRKLSQVDPLSVNVLLNDESPAETLDKEQLKKVFNIWIDRPSVTPDETAVLRVKTNTTAPAEYRLSAKVARREGGPVENLLFHLEEGAPKVPDVPLQLNEFYALPTSSLRNDTKGILHAGDTLLLEVTCKIGEEIKSAILTVPVKQSSSLPQPSAMYSLIVADQASAWCAAHSPVPIPEKMWTEVLNPATDKLLRRGVFSWQSYDQVTTTPLSYAILKAEKTTESTHIPQTLEQEITMKPRSG